MLTSITDDASNAYEMPVSMAVAPGSGAPVGNVIVCGDDGDGVYEMPTPGPAAGGNRLDLEGDTYEMPIVPSGARLPQATLPPPQQQQQQQQQQQPDEYGYEMPMLQSASHA